MTHEEIGSQEWIDRIEELVHRAEAIDDPKVRNVAVDLLRAVLIFHSAGLERILELVAASGHGGEEIMGRLAADDLVSSVLLLHGIHPDDLETRVHRAVEKLQQVFGSHGGGVSLIAIDGEVVRVRFATARAWSGAPVKASIQAAIFQAAPEITSVIVEGFQDPAVPNFVPLSELLAGAQA